MQEPLVFFMRLKCYWIITLIKGGDLNNAIVYVDKPLSKKTMEKLSKAFKKDSVKVKPNGILDNLNLHWANEAARHKLLDVIGDLAFIRY